MTLNRDAMTDTKKKPDRSTTVSVRLNAEDLRILKKLSELWDENASQVIKRALQIAALKIKP